jgi:hypothetical protein
VSPSDRTFSHYQSSQAKLKRGIPKLLNNKSGRERSITMLRERPEETISFNERVGSIKSGDLARNTEVSRERKGSNEEKNRKNPPNSTLIE